MEKVYTRLNGSLQELANQKKKNQDVYLLDVYQPIDVLKLFHGLEIHNMSKAFHKFKNGISLDTFIIVSLRILDVKFDHAPHLVLGLKNLFAFLTRNSQNRDVLSFKEFIDYFMKMQTLTPDLKAVFQSEEKNIKFRYLPGLDVVHHDRPIRTAYFFSEQKLLFSLDEISDHVKIFGSEGQFKGKIMAEKRKH